MDRRWPQGYALITETRTLSIPAGDSVIRFEGVAEGLLPETAIVTGLPKGVREKNRDARLISPAGLVDAYLKRQVFLRRTSVATGKIVEQEAIIQAGPNGGVILQTPQGVEALRCSGLPERMIYPGVPADLSAKPTLSVLASSDRAVSVTVTLSYMAQGFDWSAAYVARVAPTGEKLGLFAWLTVANGGAQSFADAQLQVVAGQPAKVANAPPLRRADPALRLRCWPMDGTSTHPRYVFTRLPWPQYREEEGDDASEQEIMVTGTRIGRRDRAFAMAAPPAPPPPPPPPVIAQQEELGDLKLYRVPMRVTVAAQSQKQVAMIDQPAMAFERVYVANVQNGDATPRPMPLILRGKNTTEKGLGLPLPSGALTLFEPVGDESLLAGQDVMADKAIGEDVEIRVGSSPDVRWSVKRVNEKNRKSGWRVDIVNAKPVPIRAEAIVPYDLGKKTAGAVRGRGGWKLAVEVPANDRAALFYTLKRED